MSIAQSLFLEIAAPYRPEGGVKQFLNVLVTRTGFAYGRVRGLYHGKAKITGDELLHLQSLRGRRTSAAIQAAEEADHASDRDRLRRLEEYLARLEPKLDALAAYLARSPEMAGPNPRGR